MNTKENPHVGRRICGIRKRRQLTQHELAAKLTILRAPIKRCMVANWETGRSVVPAYWIPFLAHALRAKVIDFFSSPARATGEPAKTWLSQLNPS